MMGGLGGFGALFDPKAAGYNDPILVSSTDGVGTKIKIAIETNRHATIGIDLVAMCVNDLLFKARNPFFLDYFATGKLELGVAQAVIEGIAKGCEETGCALIGGETAEMPGMYQAGDYDLAGFTVGAAERGTLIRDGTTISAGDVVLGLPSSGVHSNGYSLVRKIVKDTGADLEAPDLSMKNKTLADALLTPTRIYVKPLLKAIKLGGVKGMAHITGGGPF